MPASPWELAADIYLTKLQRLQNKVLLTAKFFQGAHLSVICTRLPTFRVHKVVIKIVRATNTDHEKPDTGSKRGLNFTAVKLTTVNVAILEFQHKINNIGLVYFVKLKLTRDLCVAERD
jgi:hypothetical protein